MVGTQCYKEMTRDCNEHWQTVDARVGWQLVTHHRLDELEEQEPPDVLLLLRQLIVAERFETTQCLGWCMSNQLNNNE